ncbi:MAG: hypothetical protein NZ873_03245 [Crenarchaeota archaeon]|nr:hypothetical protein [Thermoproteota archaeon]MDW8034754.1 hypothetical protein [Nitrososphaerota archaeon]
MKNKEDLNKIIKMIMQKKLDEAEKQIENLKPDDDYEAGYLKGLKGIIYSLRKPVEGSVIESGDPKANLRSIKESTSIHYLSKEEEGYFTAWLDFLKKLSASKEEVVKKEPGK